MKAAALGLLIYFFSVCALAAVVPAREPFFEWLADNPQTSAFAVYSFFGTVGVLGHYLVRWARDEIKGSIFAYMFTQYPKRTLLTGIAFYTTAAGYVLSGALDTMGWGAIIASAVPTGYAADSIFNRWERENVDAPTV